MPSIAVLGFAPHSGWATVVALGGSRQAPRVLERSRIEMADPSQPGSKQPYHAVQTLDVAEAARRLEGYVASAEAMAYDAVHALVENLAMRGFRVASAGLLDSSGRKVDALASILASHALIHTADGEHFRSALVSAAKRNGLDVTRVRARDLEARAKARLHRPVEKLHQAVKELGREVGPPWAADQKQAALLAWTLLDGA